MELRLSPSSPQQDFTAISLFSGAGIGDVGFQAAGAQFLATCELEADRAALAELNIDGASHFVADIEQEWRRLADEFSALVSASQQELFLITCTAPCQGMSKSGMGKLLSSIRKGERPELDPRNRLILPALEIIRRLRPQWVVFENVLEMRTTLIEDRSGDVRQILDIVTEQLGPDYVGEAYEVECADYGVPQRRGRLISVFTREPIAKARYQEGFGLIPRPTHSVDGAPGTKPWVTVAEALEHFPPLDAGSLETTTAHAVPFHRVPLLDEKKYEWVRNTPPGASAFDNQCVHPSCGFQDNPTHRNRREHGINRASRDTPLYCAACGKLLPRPYTDLPGGGRRLMRGFTSAYKRMAADLPAPTLTRNLSYACSDHKIHPTQHRVLSLAEAMFLQTINEYSYRWGPIARRRGRGPVKLGPAPDTLIRLVIGESVPPKFLEMLGRHICSMSESTSSPTRALVAPSRQQPSLLTS
jgi:DNA (cytosine-5)-methyltransferase 1